MRDVIAAIEAFRARATDVFDRVDVACKRIDERLDGLDARLTVATARLETARGDQGALVVHSARTLPIDSGTNDDGSANAGGGRRGERVATQAVERPLGGIASFGTAGLAALPEDYTDVNGHRTWQAPPARTAAEDLARAVRSVAAPPGDDFSLGGTSSRSALARDPSLESRPLPPNGRLGAVGELFLFNSVERPYSRQDITGYSGGDLLYTKNLTNLLEEEEEDEDAVLARATATAEAARREAAVASRAPFMLTQDDGQSRENEDIRFMPKPKPEVCLVMPPMLPSLETQAVATLVWPQEQAALETDKPAWDALPEALSGGAIVRTQLVAPAAPFPPSVPAPPSPRPELISDAETERLPTDDGTDTEHPLTFEPPSLFPATGPMSVAEAAAAVVAARVAATAPKAPQSVPQRPAPPLPQQKGSGVGEGKGAPPPPPQQKGSENRKGKGAPPPPPANITKGKGNAKGREPRAAAPAGVSTAKLLDDIRGGPRLRKVGPPKEKTGAVVGRVL
eukprot:TRINITY_DN48194_c0_g1_i1.p1 TRINITY_DN48194_c0_g1~~TRINITY_DN48194_c0_g1_i1.p1  ORF type:complete len:511 (+),score=95.33 TRINITY_DN48194_c0_g1_i1:218-1750(+)